MLARFGAAHDQPAAEEFFVVQFLYRASRFVDGLHLHKGKPFRALVVAITHDFRVLDVPDSVEQFEKIALGCVEGQVANVQTWRSDFDPFRFTCRSGRLSAVAGSGDGGFRRAVAKKCGDPLPECLFLRFRFSPLMTRVPIAPASRTAARTMRASPG